VSARMLPVKTPGEASLRSNAASLAMSEARSPLEQLLHALNQPLTGLQCSMEVALAGVRTPEQYVQGLREGLVLTERMRALVEAIREVVDGDEGESKEGKSGERKSDDAETAGLNTAELNTAELNTAELNTADLNKVLREVADDLGPVAEAKSVCITLDCAAAPSLVVKAGRHRLAAVVFRLLESALSLAARGSALRIETGGGAPAEGWIRIRWHGGGPRAEFSPPELGLLVAQAGWERAGAEWNRERRETLETVTVRLPGVSDGVGNSSGFSPGCFDPGWFNPGDSK
jgi:signal transduction histidine kinase